jgi:ELWxxDGT repeat protein
MVKDLDPVGGSTPHDFVTVPGAVHFQTSPTSLIGIWTSDGTDPGTSFLSDQTLPIGSLDGFYLFARDGELWRSDGTGPGTSLLATIDPAGTSGATFLAKQAGKLYFFAAGPSLWVTDGTSAGTVQLLATIGFSPAMTCDASLCYLVESDSGSTTLWRTDGTLPGTTAIKNIADVNALKPILVGGVAYFATLHEVWRTDGTPAGTAAIFSDPVQLVSPFVPLTHLGGDLFFVVSSDALGIHLWRSDGTPVGTEAVADLERGATNVVTIDGALVLGVLGPTLIDDLVSTDVWRVQKFDLGTEQLVTLADGARNFVHCPTPICSCHTSRPEQSAVVAGKWYFEALDPQSFNPRLGVVSNVYFRDVTPGHWAFTWVEKLADAGMTQGCGSNTYCPEAVVSRAEMAVLLLHGIHSPSYTPPPATGLVFADVRSGLWAAAWIEQLAAEGLTGGCGGIPQLYCPDADVTRGQMAVLLLRAKEGGTFLPPAATGMFADVPAGSPLAPWIEELARRGVTTGCATGPARYCPDAPVTRAQMAVFLVRTFGP